jgi:predicted hotdog family 3-hydroxylacyl-ACP dehydratase
MGGNRCWTNMTIGKRDIAGLIPHAGAMCLLDTVVEWDSTNITCVASSHRDRDNPLASGGRLDVICGIEYAAQAMAVHSRLTRPGDGRPEAGYLASARDVVCRVARLDLLPDDLMVSAELLHFETSGALYGFRLWSGTAAIMEGRAAVVLAVARASA